MPTIYDLLLQLKGLPGTLPEDLLLAQEGVRSSYLGRHGKLYQVLAKSGGLTPAELELLKAEAAKIKAELEALLP